MKRSSPRLLILATAFFFAIPSLPANAQSYMYNVITELTAFDKQDEYGVGGVNDLGQVVGTCKFPNSTIKVACIYKDKKFTIVPTPGASQGKDRWGLLINNKGLVVGRTKTTVSNYYPGFIWDPVQNSTKVLEIPFNYNDSVATAIAANTNTFGGMVFPLPAANPQKVMLGVDNFWGPTGSNGRPMSITDSGLVSMYLNSNAVPKLGIYDIKTASFIKYIDDQTCTGGALNDDGFMVCGSWDGMYYNVAWIYPNVLQDDTRVSLQFPPMGPACSFQFKIDSQRNIYGYCYPGGQNGWVWSPYPDGSFSSVELRKLLINPPAGSSTVMMHSVSPTGNYLVAEVKISNVTKFYLLERTDKEYAPEVALN